MTTAFTTYLENALLSGTLRNSAYSPAATVYAALFTSATDVSGGGTEVSGNAYARQAVTFAAPSGGVSSNSGIITFGPATPSGWGSITYFAIYDALTSGNMLYQGALTTPKTVAAGDAAQFAAGQIQVTLN